MAWVYSPATIVDQNGQEIKTLPSLKAALAEKEKLEASGSTGLTLVERHFVIRAFSGSLNPMRYVLEKDGKPAEFSTRKEALAWIRQTDPDGYLSGKFTREMAAEERRRMRAEAKANGSSKPPVQADAEKKPSEPKEPKGRGKKEPKKSKLQRALEALGHSVITQTERELNG